MAPTITKEGAEITIEPEDGLATSSRSVEANLLLLVLTELKKVTAEISKLVDQS